MSVDTAPLTKHIVGMLEHLFRPADLNALRAGDAQIQRLLSTLEERGEDKSQ